MRRILFVDDEAHVIDGLRNLLRKQRREWDMVFALSGNAALVELEKGPVDVIVSDMRMPGMDGVALLKRVKETYPAVARIVLSGHAEREAVMAALPFAHQYLSKPCDADALRIVIERVCTLQSSLLADESIRRVVGSIDKLPSVPDTYWELTRAVGDPKMGIADMAKIVERDPAMSVKVLQLVNSAYFGLAQHVASVDRAVNYLGAELLKGLALTAHVFSAMGSAKVPGFSIDEVQQHSLLTAKIARRFLPDRKRAEEAFTAALVHDIGRMIIAMTMPDSYADVLREAAEKKTPIQVIEKERLGATHADVGAYLQGVWGLPFAIVEAAAFHHTPSSVTEGPCDVLAALHVADALVEAGGQAPGGSKDETLDLPFLQRSGFAAQLPRWRSIVDEELKRVN